MKKGCFLKVIIILTILTAAVLYIVQNHFDELILNPGKKIVKSIMMSGVEENLANVKENIEKDSTRFLIENYINNAFSEKNEINSNEIEWIIDSLNFYIQDSIIDNSDFQKIKEIIKENTLK